MRRKDHLELMGHILQAINPPEPFSYAELHQWLHDFPDLHVPAPWKRTIKLSRLQTMIKRLEWAGILEPVQSEEHAYNARKVRKFRFKEGDKVKIWAKIRKKYMDEIVEGKKRLEFRQVEDLILSDGKRTLHTRVLDIRPAGFMEEQIKAEHPGIPWDPQLPIFIFTLEPTALYEGGKYQDLAQVKPAEPPAAPPEDPPDDSEGWTIRLPDELTRTVHTQSAVLKERGMEPAAVIMPRKLWDSITMMALPEGARGMDIKPTTILGMPVVLSDTADRLKVAAVPVRWGGE